MFIPVLLGLRVRGRRLHVVMVTGVFDAGVCAAIWDRAPRLF